MLTADDVWGAIGRIVGYSGVATAIAYTSFKVLTTKWLDSRFAERLEAFKHDQAKELERVKYEINTLFSRNAKIQEKEFDILPTAWAKLNKARTRIAQSILAFQSYPDFNRMSAREFDEYTKELSLSDYERTKFADASDKNRWYSNYLSYSQIFEATKAYQVFHIYLSENSIFLKPDLKKKFEDIDQIMWNALIARKLGDEHKEAKLWVEAVNTNKDIPALVSELEKLVQGRLYPPNLGN